MAHLSTRKRTSRSGLSSAERETRIQLIDEFDEKCAQAMAIAGLLMEADVEQNVQDSAWAIRALIEKAAGIARQLL